MAEAFGFDAFSPKDIGTGVEEVGVAKAVLVGLVYCVIYRKGSAK